MTMTKSISREGAHAVYLALFNTDADIHTQIAVMSQLFAAACGGTSWRVVGITPAAARIVAEGRPNLTKSGIQRGHLTDRRDTIAAMFERDAPMGCDEMFAFWIERDVTVVCMADENKRIASTEWLPLDNPDGDLFAARDFNFRYRRKVEPLAARAALRL